MPNLKTQVLFINPSIKKETQHPLFNSLIFSTLPFGLGYVAGYLRYKNNLKVKVIDEVATYLSDEALSEELINLEEPCIIGISCLTATYSRAIELARKIKQINKSAKVIFGGVHATVLPEESLSSGAVDIVVRNEGEITVSKLCESIRLGKNIEDIEGISLLKNGKVQHNPNRKERVTLDTLPDFPYDLFEHNIASYTDFGCIFTSRGCPFDCIFCSNRVITGKLYRSFNVNYVIKQIRLLIKKYKQKSIYFIDDNIIVDKKRFFALTNAIQLEGLHKEAFFSIQFRGEDIDDEILGQLRKTNFRMVSCGIETAIPRLMDLINKNESIDAIVRGVKLSNSNGFLTSATFIYGIPTETKLDRSASSRLACSLPLDSVRFNIAIPYPGTKLFEMAKAEGKLHIAKDWKNFNVQYYLFGDDIPYVPFSTTRYRLIFDTMWANARFYLRLKTIKSIIFKTDITGGGVLSFQNRRKLLKTYISLVMVVIFILNRFIHVSIKAGIERFKNEN